MLSLSDSVIYLALCFFFYCSTAHRDLHSFPTRRSSDLPRCISSKTPTKRRTCLCSCAATSTAKDPWCHAGFCVCCRSEEHTSELQSHHDLVCRLLLEKKNKNHEFDHRKNHMLPTNLALT